MRIYLHKPFDHTHENQFFRELASILITVFSDEENTVLIGNPTIADCAPDAIFIRSGQLSVIEFKNYGGTIDYDEDGVWYVINGDSETVIDYSGRDTNVMNPMQQVNRYRSKIKNLLRSEIWNYGTAPNPDHVSSIILFHKPVVFDHDLVRYPMRSYFHVAGPDTIATLLTDIRSSQLDISRYDIDFIFKQVGLNESHIYNPTIQASPTVKELESTQEQHPNEAELDIILPQVLETDAIVDAQTVNSDDVIHQQKEYFDRLFSLAIDLINAQVQADADEKKTESGKRDAFKTGRSIHQALLFDLEDLQKLDGTTGYGVLGHVWNPDQSYAGSILPEVAHDNIVAVTPLNEHQRKAVASGLTRRLTGVTGPPGTGKTQVVINLAVNALLRGEKVVVASKNNRAIDVVRDRLENILGFPYGLRLGQRQDEAEHQSKYLEKLSNRRMNQLDRDRSADLATFASIWQSATTAEKPQWAIDWLKATIEHEFSKLDLDLVHEYAYRVQDVTNVMWLFVSELGMEDKTGLKSLKPHEIQSRFIDQHSLFFTTALTARLGLPCIPESIDLVIIDEASQCDLVSMYPLLVRAKRVVVIGDPLQLRHVTQVSDATDAELAKKHQFLPIQYPRRSLYDAVFQRLHKLKDYSIVFLQDHFRCHASIVGFANTHFYEPHFGSGLIPVDGIVPSEGGWFWHDVDGQLMMQTNGNPTEAEHVAKVYSEVRQRLGNDVSIGIITPYKHQVDLIGDILSEAKSTDDRLTIDTVHRFQGDERDIVILSVTVAPSAKSERLANYLNGGNLVNVAVTRAKRELHVVGNRQFLLRQDRNSALGKLARWDGVG
jgi:KaiC/GvpD/RAD55 family RecA-like ATPase